MKIAVTGGTGFLGRYILRDLSAEGHEVKAWYRSLGKKPFIVPGCAWVEGQLGRPSDAAELCAGCDGLVHAALEHDRKDWSGGRDLVAFLQANLIGSIQLFQAAQAAGVKKCIFVSTCAVYDRILDDRPLDETHPLYPRSFYGAHKAAVEAFVHALAQQGLDICIIRPTGIYGVAEPIDDSKWFELVRDVVHGKPVMCQMGGKEVHAADVARAISLLLARQETRGQVYNCYDSYIADYHVATLAKNISGSAGELIGKETKPKHQIETGNLRALGMKFGGEDLLRHTVEELVRAVRGR